MTDWQKPNLMGVLNITPDSFSDGGQFTSLQSALAQAEMLSAQGAEIIDVGGESTRPGAERVSLETEQERVLPVIEALSQQSDLDISIDTMNSQTARKAVEAGAKIVNDISGGLADSEMFSAIQDLECKYVLGHWRGHSDQMDSRAVYSDVAREVVAELAEQVSMAVASGISRDRIIVDPGLGFAKDIHQNWDLVNRLDELQKLGLPVLVGASRKRFIAHALSPNDPASVSMPRRDLATAVLTALLLQRKLWGVRVHDVQATSDAIAIVQALKQQERAQ